VQVKFEDTDPGNGREEGRKGARKGGRERGRERRG